METIATADEQAASDWNAFIDCLLQDEGCQAALDVAVTSKCIWELFIHYRCLGNHSPCD